MTGQLEFSTVVCIVLDLSGSMRTSQEDACKACFSISLPLTDVGAFVQIAGFSGQVCKTNEPDKDDRFHRTAPVTHTIIKRFDEPLAAVKHRFAGLASLGRTPLADGLQFALDAIFPRPETRKWVFVFTDGKPDHGTDPVIRRQLRVARQNGVHMIGIGVNEGAEPVSRLFSDYVLADSFKELPEKLVVKLMELAGT